MNNSYVQIFLEIFRQQLKHVGNESKLATFKKFEKHITFGLCKKLASTNEVTTFGAE
jgi:hypothetical protein